MDMQSVINSLLVHLVETTVERDNARKEVQELRIKLAEHINAEVVNASKTTAPKAAAKK